MASYAGEGGSSTVTRASSLTATTKPSVSYARGAADTPDQERPDLVTAIEHARNQAALVTISKEQRAYWNKQLENLEYIRDHPPLKTGEKSPKEKRDDETIQLLLDLIGYGSAIASLIPHPAARAVGSIGPTVYSAGRAFTRGNYEAGMRSLGRAAREASRTVERNSRKRRKAAYTSRKRR